MVEHLICNHGISVQFWVGALRYYGDVMKKVDILDLGSSAERRVGSNPIIPTNIILSYSSVG